MLIGYARVSTQDQNLDLQRDALTRASCERIYEDVASGSRAKRPEFDRMLDALRDGDVVVVWKLDRLGRSLRHLVNLVHDLDTRGIGFKVLTGEIDTTTPAGKLIFGIFASLAEFERDLIRERTAAGLDAARARGRKGGRPRKMTKEKLQAAMAMMADPGNSATAVANALGVAVPTLYMYIDGKGRPKTKANAVLHDK